MGETDPEYFDKVEQEWASMSKMLRATITADLLDGRTLYNIIIPIANRLPQADD